MTKATGSTHMLGPSGRRRDVTIDHMRIPPPEGNEICLFKKGFFSSSFRLYFLSLFEKKKKKSGGFLYQHSTSGPPLRLLLLIVTCIFARLHWELDGIPP